MARTPQEFQNFAMSDVSISALVHVEWGVLLDWRHCHVSSLLACFGVPVGGLFVHYWLWMSKTRSCIILLKGHTSSECVHVYASHTTHLSLLLSIHVSIDRCIVGSSPTRGTEHFGFPPSAPRLGNQRPWYIQPRLCDWAYKRSRATYRKEKGIVSRWSVSS